MQLTQTTKKPTPRIRRTTHQIGPYTKSSLSCEPLLWHVVALLCGFLGAPVDLLIPGPGHMETPETPEVEAEEPSPSQEEATAGDETPLFLCRCFVSLHSEDASQTVVAWRPDLKNKFRLRGRPPFTPFNAQCERARESGSS